MSNQKVIDILIESRDRLTPKDAWTQKSMARDEKGVQVLATSSSAVCWCMSGAVIATVGLHVNMFRDVAIALAFVIGSQTAALPDYNDNPFRTQSQVLAVFDKAIENLRKIV